MSRLDQDTTVAVIGAGSMGAGIAQLAAQSGHAVRLFDTQPGAASRAVHRIEADLAAAVARGRIDEAQRVATGSRLTPVGSLEALAGCGLAVEAIVERLDAKRALFAQLEPLLGEGAVLATNTSSISITAVAQGLARPERVIGWHFFNPATRMKLVEIICGVETDAALVEPLAALSRAWGKTPVVAPNAPGFIVNRIARPYYAEALRLLGERIAGPEAIDHLLREAGVFAMGPFELIDLIGADVNLAVTESVFAATAWDSRYAPDIIQQELVRAGRHGRKTGAGFYSYAAGVRAPVAPLVAPAAPAVDMRVATTAGTLQPLVERLRQAGVALETDAGLAPGTIAFGATHAALTDGRTLAERAVHEGRPMLLLDLAHDYATTPVVGATGSDADLALLAASLRPTGIGVIALADVAGLVVMRVAACIVNQACELMTWSGTAAADIDISMRLGMGYRSGPLAWGDAIGAARLAEVLANLQAHYGDPRYRRSPRLSAACHGGGPLHG